ncbi:MAG: hypothetical protein N3D11_08550 [Candidatus Sumerlaeia bacterium]|nr:hypothetical protein [Candidatus Sumerlaeia bacterium]
MCCFKRTMGAAALLLITAAALAGPGTLTYQGSVVQPNGTPIADGTYQMRFALYIVPSGGSWVWQETSPTVTVRNGLFSMTLGNITPFGTLFSTRSDLWLEVWIDLDKNGTLAAAECYLPRQKLAAAAWAIEADRLNGRSSADFATAAHTHAGMGDITGVTAGAGLTGGGLSGNVSLAARFGGNGTSTSVARADHRHADGWLLRGNAGTTSGTDFVGTTDNQPLDLRVNNARALRFLPDAEAPSLIGGHRDNYVTSGVAGAVIAGGGTTGWANRVTDHYGAIGGGRLNRAGNDNRDLSDAMHATVSGGYLNVASGKHATVGGGTENVASGAWGATIAGGVANTASANYHATVGGGLRNVVSGNGSVVAGGEYNLAGGWFATVPGGRFNQALGEGSCAVGQNAVAGHLGTFVWNDTNTTFASTAEFQFLIHAAGGVGININNPAPFALRVAGPVGIGGILNMGAGAGNERIINLADPISAQDAATKNYVDNTLVGVDADRLDGQHGSYYQNADNLNAGTVHTDRYSARSDLADEGYLGNGAGHIAVNNGTLQSTLNADMLDGQHASDLASASHNHTHSSLTGLGNDDHAQYFHLGQNEICTGRPSFNGGVSGSFAPFNVNSTFVVTNLNADLLDGRHAGHATGNIPYSDGVLNVDLNADQLDGRHAGHGSGSIPYNDGVVNTMLNADMVDGQHAADFASSSHSHLHSSLTGLSDDDHTQYFHLDQHEIVNGRPAFNGGVSGATPPFSVDSTQRVDNLNADQLDGKHASDFATLTHDHWGQSWTGMGTGLSVSGGDTGLSGSGVTAGVYGQSSGGGAYNGGGGAFLSTAPFANGVYGVSSSGYGTGVHGKIMAGTVTNQAFGVWGECAAPGYAGYFSGNVHVDGTISKAGGGFKIDHPLDPANKYLYHSFVESPDMKNIYDGTVTLDPDGRATVTLPEWFGALNKDFRYQLTAIGAPAPGLYIAREIENNQFEIAGGPAGLKVSWQVTGIRKDAFANTHRIPVEETKPPSEQGTYLCPELHGKPAGLSVTARKRESKVR